jgi:4'-phosphopantetheinyl transferase
VGWTATEDGLRLALEPDEVHLWRAPLDVSDDTQALLSRALGSDEHERARRFRFERDRVRWTAARGWLRHLLAGYLGADPAVLRFELDDLGKPRLTRSAHWLRFNVSHSTELAVFAVAHSREVGVDVELVGGDPSASPVPARFLSQSEQAALALLAGSTRRRASLQCWTGKEAYLKATGVGLQGPIAEIDVTWLLEQPDSTEPERAEGVDAGWSISAFDPGPDHVGAIAVQGRGAGVPLTAMPLSLPISSSVASSP